MSERRKTRIESREPEPMGTNYDQAVRAKEARNKRMAEGKVIVKGNDLPWELNRQGRIKFFLTDRSEDVAAPGWLVFQQEIHSTRACTGIKAELLSSSWAARDIAR